MERLNQDRPEERLGPAFRRNWDALGVAGALGHFAVTRDADLAADDYFVIEALRRSRSDLASADTDTLREYVNGLDDSQLPGLINNLKGIAHEIEFVALENEDGDAWTAQLFEATNHPDHDVILTNVVTGDQELIQLKATDDGEYAREAIDELGAAHVGLPSDLAQRLGTLDTGVDHDELEQAVVEVVDVLREDPSLWAYMPGLTAWSSALIIAELVRRYVGGELAPGEFARLVVIIGGAKALNVALIVAALSTPGLNIVCGAWLFYRLGGFVMRTWRT